jgi:hypothetical protein
LARNHFAEKHRAIDANDRPEDEFVTGVHPVKDWDTLGAAAILCRAAGGSRQGLHRVAWEHERRRLAATGFALAAAVGHQVISFRPMIYNL